MVTVPTSSQHGLARDRLLRSIAAGVVLGGAVGPFVPGVTAGLLGWDGVAAAFLLQVWPRVLRLKGEDVARQATAEDNSRAAAELLLVGACVTSLVGGALGLVEASHHDGVAHGLMTGIAVLTVVLSWTVVHTVFALRYASVYYGDTPGGIDFGEGGRMPDYRDMAYIAFTVGMTYQVSDTDIVASDLRRTVLKHALLSYLFGTGVVAVTINVVAGLF
jgi:uncharacterized membrane protein